MKTIGLVGGSGWISTADYYKIINEGVNARLGGNHFARMILYSVDFHDISERSQKGDMEGIGEIIVDGAKRVEGAGADCILLCANTWHIFADLVKSKINKPLIHIGEETVRVIRKAGLKKVGLLGTKPTMEMDFIKGILLREGIEALVPEEGGRAFIHRTIVHDLMKGVFDEAVHQRLVEITDQLIGDGAEGIILGCTELPLILKKEDFSVPVFDTTHIHSMAAVDFALNG